MKNFIRLTAINHCNGMSTSSILININEIAGVFTSRYNDYTNIVMNNGREYQVCESFSVVEKMIERGF